MSFVYSSLYTFFMYVIYIVQNLQFYHFCSLYFTTYSQYSVPPLVSFLMYRLHSLTSYILCMLQFTVISLTTCPLYVAIYSLQSHLMCPLYIAVFTVFTFIPFAPFACCSLHSLVSPHVFLVFPTFTASFIVSF